MSGLDSATSALLREFRRDLHAHPELRFTEVRTAAKLTERLEVLGLEVETGVAETGVVARLTTGRPGPHVLVRADMDALPTPDLKSVDYASTNDGISHACGHDVHTTVVLGIAEVLSQRPPACGAVTFVFQPAEEIPFGEPSGGAAIVATGLLDDVDLVLGLHCWPALPAGTIGVDGTTAMASKKAFRISVRGIGAHAATPSHGRDAVLAASSLVVHLNQLLGREMDPGERAALNVGTITGGRSQSIVAPSAEITGTIRTVDAALSTRLRDAVDRVAAGTAHTFGVEATVEWKNDMPPVVNDAELVQRALAVLQASPSVVVELLDAPPMTADDFALYAQERPGLYVKLGVTSGDGALGGHPLHDGRFDVDESSIDVGVLGLTALIDDLMSNGWGERAS